MLSKGLAIFLLWILPIAQKSFFLTPLKKERFSNCSCNRESISVPGHDSYPNHIKAAKAWPNSSVVADSKLDEKKKKGNLIKFGKKDGRKIAHLTHSHDLLHPGPAKVFDELSQRFHDEVASTSEADSKIVISSLCRTKEQQKSLMKTNRAATRGISSHSYGASIDIRNIETSGSCKAALGKLQKVIREMKKEGKILVIREGACLHLTAKER
jgi:hypothetical protein